jgi:hypothetical protein
MTGIVEQIAGASHEREEELEASKASALAGEHVFNKNVATSEALLKLENDRRGTIILKASETKKKAALLRENAIEAAISDNPDLESIIAEQTTAEALAATLDQASRRHEAYNWLEAKLFVMQHKKLQSECVHYLASLDYHIQLNKVLCSYKDTLRINSAISISPMILKEGLILARERDLNSARLNVEFYEAEIVKLNKTALNLREALL